MQDNLVTAAYFSTAVHTIEKPDFLDKVTPIFDEYVAMQDKTNLNDMYPVIMTGNMNLEPRLNDFLSYIASTAWNILNAQGYKMDDKITYFQEIWGQEHYKYSNMDEHIHALGSQICGFYFIDCPENSSQIILHDPRVGKKQINMPEADTSKITEATSMISFKPKNGMLFFTNAWLPHSFTKNGSDKPFKFLHFNLGVSQAPENKPIII